MGLPANNEIWPPRQWTDTYARYALHAAWYSGEPNQLANVYSLMLDNPLFAECRFWARQASGERAVMVHVPIATDIAKTSAALLFADHPQIKMAESDGTELVEAQGFLEEMTQAGWWRRCHEAAETASALGGVVLKLCWDRALSDHPILAISQADNALLEFRFGHLLACTLWKELENDGIEVLRWVERHEPGVIHTGLYRGTLTDLGAQIGLDAHPETRGIQAVQTTGLDGLACVYVPNTLPNRVHRGSYLGVSDYQGSETLMDSLDEVYTKLQQDIIFAQARVFGAESMLSLDSADKKLKFRPDQEVYVGLGGVTNQMLGLKDQLVVSQFEIRAQQHIETAKEYVARIVNAAGYSPNTFGLDISGAAESGVALRTKHYKTVVTTAMKAEYWAPALRYLLYAAQIVYREQLGGRIVPQRATVEMQDSTPTDFMQVAQSIEMLRRSQAMSIDTAVRLQHPDWDESSVTGEVGRIREEEGMNVPDPMSLGRGNLQ